MISNDLEWPPNKPSTGRAQTSTKQLLPTPTRPGNLGRQKALQGAPALAEEVSQRLTLWIGPADHLLGQLQRFLLHKDVCEGSQKLPSPQRRWRGNVRNVQAKHVCALPKTQMRRSLPAAPANASASFAVCFLQCRVLLFLHHRVRVRL